MFTVNVIIFSVVAFVNSLRISKNRTATVECSLRADFLFGFCVHRRLYEKSFMAITSLSIITHLFHAIVILST